MATPRTAVLVTLASLGLAGLLGVEGVAERVRVEPESDRQQVVLSVLGSVAEGSRAVHLTRPRRWLRGLVGRGETSVEVIELSDSAADTGHTGHTDDTVATTVPDGPIAPVRTGPLEVWVLGDSLINMGGPRLATLLEEDLGARVHVESRPNTGLVRPDYFDWPGAVARHLETRPPPELVVVLMGANDGQNMRVDGKRTERWSEPWQDAYAVRVAQVLDPLTDAGARVAWLGLPGMRRRGHQRTADTLNSILADTAVTRPLVHFLPTEARFAYGGRRFSTHLERPDGQRFPARAGDGVHFTWSGSRVLADHVLSDLRQTWPDLFMRRETPERPGAP